MSLEDGGRDKISLKKVCLYSGFDWHRKFKIFSRFGATKLESIFNKNLISELKIILLSHSIKIQYFHTFLLKNNYIDDINNQDKYLRGNTQEFPINDID